MRNCRRHRRWLAPCRGDGVMTVPASSASHDLDQRGRSTAAKSGAWHQDGVPTSKWPRLRLSFSAWLYSPSSGFPFGQNHEGRGAPRLAPLLLALPAHRLARRVLRLEPHHRWPAAIGRIRPLRHDTLQPHPATWANAVGPSPVRCSVNRMERRLAQGGQALGLNVPSTFSADFDEGRPECWGTPGLLPERAITAQAERTLQPTRMPFRQCP